MELTLIFPHQLFKDHPAIRKGRSIYLVENPLFFGNDPHWPAAMHRQKLVLHRASMQAYREELEEQGYKTEYVDVPEGNTTDSAALLEKKIPNEVTAIHLADPVDEILLKRIKRFAGGRGIDVVIYPSPNFLSPPEFLAAHLASGKKPFMAKFYEAQRKRMGILLDKHGGPEGGKWSYDTENRARLPKNHVPPVEPMAPPDADVEEAIGYIDRKFPDNPGSTQYFRWPVTRADAEKWLDHFLEERFADFGQYEDAISTQYATLYHSAITPALNIGLLDPAEVVERVLKKGAKAKIPLNSVEGYIRQIIGWREFMRGIYQHHGTEIRNANFWGFDRPMPKSFYDGTTGIPPVDRVIRQLLSDGWCHHIERLMILGNFMLLCRIKPDDVYRWFMELFVDSYDWVMVPNVYGMSQFADGGTFTTKPYISGSNYVLKMSDETKGPWCEIWDGLFWTFIADYLPFFEESPRLSIMARTWGKLSGEKQAGHRGAAEGFLATLS